MKTFLTLAVLAIAVPALAAPQVCTFGYAPKGSALNWTAFKTPKKVGLKAQFSDFDVKMQEASSIEQLLASATFTVNSQSVVTGDKARDAKIMQFFFKKMVSGTKITGKVLKVEKNKVEVELNMNGVKKVTLMSSKYDEATKQLSLTGSIDVLDFSMKDNLATLTKACYEKHEGVTWPNVDLEFVAAISKTCM